MLENGTGAASEALTGKKTNRTTTTPKAAVQKKMLMLPTPNYKLGIEVGTVFTNFVLLNVVDGALYFEKTLTTYPDSIDGVLNGLSILLQTYKVSLAHVRTIVHGTALITQETTERKETIVGLITTKIFKGLLEMEDEILQNPYDIDLKWIKAQVPKQKCYGISAQLNETGHVVESLNINELASVVEALAAQKVAAIAVYLQHSVVNSVHEHQIGDFLKRRFPNLYFSLSSEMMPEFRGSKRAAVTLLNASFQPMANEYLNSFKKRLEAIDFKGIIYIVNSLGHLTTWAEARKIPVQLWQSGGVGAAMASLFLSKMLKIPHLWTFDMGGMSAKSAFVRNKELKMTHCLSAIAQKTSDFPARFESIDFIEMGTGGNSRVRAHANGILTVAQDDTILKSMPICYAHGGEMPTLTDADLVLGFLNADYFLGGSILLRKDLAINALEEKVAKPLGISVEAAAERIRQTAHEKIAKEVKMQLLERGLDPKTVPMMASGSAGSGHAFEIARLVGASQLMIPVGAGVASALGFLVSPVATEAILNYSQPISNMDCHKINLFLHQAEMKGLDFLRRAYISMGQSIVRRFAKMRYVEDDREIMVALPNATPISMTSIPTIEQNFDAAYLLQYGQLMPEGVREMVALRVIVSSSVPNLPLKQVTHRTKHPSSALKGHRLVYFSGDWVECAVYDRYALRAGDKLPSPALIEEVESTIFIGSNATIHLDRFENIIVNLHY